MTLRTVALTCLLAATAAVTALAPGANAWARPPCAPTDFAAMPQGVVIHLTWTVLDGSSETDIYRAAADGNFTLSATVQAPGNESFDTQVEQGVTYRYYAVSILDGTPTDACGEVTATANSQPCAPELSADVMDDAIHLSWTGVVVADSYNVYRGEAGGNLTLLANTTASEQTYVDATVQRGTSYAYEVHAVVGGQERPACNTVEVATIPVFPAPWAAGAAIALGAISYVIVHRGRKST